ncbi:MAG: hypothetical protein GY821_03820 [Gammaproteobacteria bacterium]|nr:hypothetical protein [Gammaproteobacteria bacterium]
MDSSYEWVAVWRDAYPYSGSFKEQLDKHHTALKEQVEWQPGQKQKLDDQVDLSPPQSNVYDANDELHMVVENDNYHDIFADDGENEDMYSDVVNVTAGGFFDDANKQKDADTQLQNKGLMEQMSG